MPDFTQGKWEVDCIYGDHWLVISDERVIIDCFKSEANARLIAAAPEMFERLDAVAKFLEYASNLWQYFDKGFSEECSEERNSIDALIARIDSRED